MPIKKNDKQNRSTDISIVGSVFGCKQLAPRFNLSHVYGTKLVKIMFETRVFVKFMSLILIENATQRVFREVYGYIEST